MNHPPQEPDVLPGRTLTGVGGGVVLATVAGVMIAIAIGRCRSHELGHEWVPLLGRPPITGDINAIETRLLSVEAQGIEAHQREDAWLHSYGWIDRAHQIVHVPIDVAIDLYLSTRQGSGK